VVYRIAQEALTNALRHSGASEVSVSLSEASGRVMLTVKDNGRGLPELVSDGAGVAGMRERAMLVGADLEIRSVPGAGVEVMLRVAAQDGSS
jgi:two-component system sensor histidine kinase UhpB